MKGTKTLFVLLFVGLCLACSDEQQKPFYVSFETDSDSLHVFVENPFHCPTFIRYQKLTDQSVTFIQLKQKEQQKIFSFPSEEMDTLTIYDKFKFLGMSYGNVPLSSYDTLYNYALPFPKGKRYKVMQGQNTNFTHKGSFSKYAIDFDMQVGQTVCAMRDGIVVKTVSKFNKGGIGKKYRDLANYIVLYHEDGLFTQYVHLKKDGVLVKVGDSVKKGQAIGYSGNTGMSTAPHLHFAVFKPTEAGLVSIPYILDSIPTKRYVKGKFAVHN
jgi:murein DD-endopeptidase MepM/ murein hydrolase activator NlpD